MCQALSFQPASCKRCLTNFTLSTTDGRDALSVSCMLVRLLAAAAQIEGQRAEQARRQQEQAALMKLEKIRLDQTNRAQTLEEEAREAEQKASPTTRSSDGFLILKIMLGLRTGSSMKPGALWCGK